MGFYTILNQLTDRNFILRVTYKVTAVLLKSCALESLASSFVIANRAGPAMLV